MLRLDPTVIRITLSDVKRYEGQRKAQDGGGRGNNTHSSLQSSTSSLLHESLRLRFLPDNIRSSEESIEIYNSPAALDGDVGDTIVEDSEKMETSPSDNEDEEQEAENESMRDTYDDRLPGLNAPRLPLPLPFSATARVTTAMNHPGTIIRLPRGSQHGESRCTAYLAPKILSKRAADVISRHNDLSTRQTLRQIPVHNDDAANTWQPYASGDLAEAEQHGRQQPPFLPSIPSPSPRSPRRGERANIPAGGIAEAIRRVGVMVDSEETDEQGMNMWRLAAPPQDEQDEVQDLED
ncbi:hypothetical protein CaCOL14_000668 [Colletotrichum acutatum]|uniref:Uncharacterized protein n=1 Tax=Glomerella acutata TaxID=27357 RepID=A0AAD8UPY5_GLOAC|nr:uncharacterized protein BDZ83DRAFT_752714 [Colletotrichum acutatum]KAK1724330.1 hypothetical protein BDZ83DRAFT_752714 [Colletotrichum acutatum]